MLALTRTLLDITFLSKGPEAIPRSWIVLGMSIGLWSFALLAMLVLLVNFDVRDARVEILSAALGVGCYTLVLGAMGVLHRAVQTLAALIGIGALITLTVLAELILFIPLLGGDVASLIARVTWMWSIPVKGHIIARAINWPWIGGFVIALSIFLLQFAFTKSMSPES